MTILFILCLIGISLVIGILGKRIPRTPLLMCFSIVIIFALQPELPIRYLDFWMPFVTIGLTILGWVLTAPPETRTWKKNRGSVLLLIIIVSILGLTRLLPFSLPITAARPPQTTAIILAMVISFGVIAGFGWLSNHGKNWLCVFLGMILLLFIILKVPSLSQFIGGFLYKANGQYGGNASATDLRWLGFSYIAFRLIHTIRDRQTGRMPSVSLSEYITYVIFFPALAAGPIDRIEHFVGEIRNPFQLNSEEIYFAGKRLLIGLTKKFVVADSLALIALNATNATQINTSGWTWVLVYAYAFQIYFDFSGYTDIAIGLGRLMGVRLPENFSKPYTKSNLTQFWNNWHITLSQWFRSYYFNPVTRALRTKIKPLPTAVIIILAQISTMVLIGLWHGFSLNFLLWGVWHGLGLFINNRWSEWIKPRIQNINAGWMKAAQWGGILLTFNYVALGWVLFALPSVSLSWHVYKQLFLSLIT